MEGADGVPHSSKPRRVQQLASTSLLASTQRSWPSAPSFSARSTRSAAPTRSGALCRLPSPGLSPPSGQACLISTEQRLTSESLSSQRAFLSGTCPPSGKALCNSSQ